MRRSAIRTGRLLVRCGVVSAILTGTTLGSVRFTERTDLPSLGLHANVMPGSVSRPLPSPRTWHYTVRRGDETWQEEQYDPLELWRHSQTVGRWSAPDGTTLLLAAPTAPRPRGFEREHVTHETYRNVSQAPHNAPPPQWDEILLTDWVRQFADVGAPTFAPVRRPSIRIQQAWRIESDTAPPARLMYLVRPAWRSARAHDRQATWIYIQLDLADGARLAQARNTLKTGMIASLAPLSFRAAAQAQQSPAPAQNEREQSRQAAIASIRNLRQWWHDETEHYVILTDVTARHRLLVNELKENLERLRALYARLVPPLAPIDAMSIIRIFDNADEYLQYVGPSYAWTGGLWMPSRRELVIRPSDHAATRDQRRHALGVAYHEGFHQYAFYALGRQNLPPWFDEGHAEFFEQAEIRGATVTIPENEQSAAIVERMIAAKNVPIPALLAMDQPAFYADNDTRRREHYALAWALIYYLHKGAPHERPALYDRILPRFRAALADGSDGGTATRHAFAPVDMTHFANHFTAFWTSRHRRSAAARVRYNL